MAGIKECPYLPTEILMTVTENCALGTLRQLRLVSKRYNAVATPLVFRTVSLCHVLENGVSVDKKISGLLDSTLAQYIRSLSVNQCVATAEFQDFGLSGFRQLLEVCAGKLEELKIYTQKTPRKDLDGDKYDPRLLWNIGRALRKVQPKALKKLEIVVDSPSFLLQMYNKVRPREPVNQSARDLIGDNESKYHQRRKPGEDFLKPIQHSVLFPNEEEIVLKFKSEVPIFKREYFCWLPMFELITKDCKKLKTFDAMITCAKPIVEQPSRTESYVGWPPTWEIVYWDKRVDTLKLENLTLNLHIAIMGDASVVLEALKPMINLKTLALKHITIEPSIEDDYFNMMYKVGRNIDEFVLWSDVFNMLGELKHPREFTLEMIKNKSDPEEFRKAAAIPEKGLGGWRRGFKVSWT